MCREEKDVATEKPSEPESKIGCLQQVYLTHINAVQPKIFFPAFALALLYLTVLSFGLLMTAYLNWKGLSEAELSIYRALGAAAGILTTFLFPWLHSKLGKLSHQLLKSNL